MGSVNTIPVAGESAGKVVLRLIGATTTSRLVVVEVAVPAPAAVPGAVAGGAVELGDERRYELPVVLVCPEYSPEQARTWIEGGDVPELTRVHNLSYVDIDTGHWPMVTQPKALADILEAAATD